MAIWTYAPQIETPPMISFGGAPALITKLSDGKEIGRRKHANEDQSWTEVYWFTGAEFDAARAIFGTYGTDLPLTKLAWDTASTPLGERTVKFNSFEETRQGEDFFEVTVSWRRVY